MVNFVVAEKSLLNGVMKMVGVKSHVVDIQPGTVMNFWVPRKTLKNPEKQPTPPNPKKPVVVLIHGFAGDGVVTWQFQIGSLTKKYSVYIPDLLFFGGSVTDSSDRSPKFQAECLMKGLRKLGVEMCTVVGFSYGGMVAFKMAELYPDMVRTVIVSGSVVALTDSVTEAYLKELGVSSSAELLLPTSTKGLRALFSCATYKNIWFPHRFLKDFLEVMFTNRKEREELLEGLVITNKDYIVPKFSQKIHFLWGEEDIIFKAELVLKMKEQIGENATYEFIKKAGHLAHLERPCAYNRCLKRCLPSLISTT